MAVYFALNLFLCLFCLPLQLCTGQEANCSCNLSHGQCDENGVCRCDPGWEGPQCEDCVRKPGCVYGSCHQPWQCICDSGWAGRFCNKDVYVCTNEQPCKNGGTCFTNDMGEYSCSCPDGFRGRNCELKTGPCEKTRSPCRNGGLCEDDRGYAAQFMCRCLAGFTGPRCEVNVDDCLLQPCANGATCLDSINRFSCLCPAGYTGRFCTVNVDDCASQPCANGGRCLDRVAAFHCFCPPGFVGKTCEVPLRINASEVNTPSWTSRGLGGAESGVTPSRPHLTVTSNISHRVTASSGRLLKISVKEVVTQRGTVLSEVQLITVLVLGGMTLAVVGMTVLLVLRGHLRDQSAQYSTPPSRLVPMEQECNISFLHNPEPQLEKKQPNRDVI